MKQRSLAYAGAVLCLIAGAAAWGQEPPAAAPAAPSAGLVYKYRPGAVSRYRYIVNGSVAVGIPRADQNQGQDNPGVVTVEVAAQYDVIERVLSVGTDGSAHVGLVIDSLASTARAEGVLKLAAKLQNGQIVFTQN